MIIIYFRNHNMIIDLYRRIRKISKSEYWLCHVYLSVRSSACMEQLGFHWTNFYDI